MYVYCFASALWNLDLCVLLIPALAGLTASKYEKYVEMFCLLHNFSCFTVVISCFHIVRFSIVHSVLVVLGLTKQVNCHGDIVAISHEHMSSSL